MQINQVGVYWFELFYDDRLITRVPSRRVFLVFNLRRLDFKVDGHNERP